MQVNRSKKWRSGDGLMIGWDRSGIGVGSEWDQMGPDGIR